MNTTSPHLGGAGRVAGTYEDGIPLKAIVSYGVIQTLKDEAIAGIETTIILAEIARIRLGLGIDVRHTDIEPTSFDYWWDQKEQEFGIEMSWVVFCDECEHVATVQGDFDANLCPQHWDVAYEEHRADLEADDIASGMRP